MARRKAAELRAENRRLKYLGKEIIRIFKNANVNLQDVLPEDKRLCDLFQELLERLDK